MLAADWSGDPGFKNIGRGGASTRLSLAMVAYNGDEVRAALARLRQDQRLPSTFEYHFAQGPSKTNRIRTEFMHRLATNRIIIVAASIDKVAISKDPRHLHGIDFIADHLCSLVFCLPHEHIDRAMLLIDGTKRDAKPLCKTAYTLIKRQAGVRRLNCRLKGIRPAESHRTDGVQIADMVAGAMQLGVGGQTPDLLAPLKGKITIIRVP